jgi:hypothetical protein
LILQLKKIAGLFAQGQRWAVGKKEKKRRRIHCFNGSRFWEFEKGIFSFVCV